MDKFLKAKLLGQGGCFFLMRIDGNKMSFQSVAPTYWGNLLFSKGFPAPVDSIAAGKQLTTLVYLDKTVDSLQGLWLKELNEYFIRKRRL